MSSVSEIRALLNDMSGTGEDKDYILKQFQSLHDQLDQTNEWFAQINQLVGADPDEPAVNSVSDYVHSARLDKEVLEIIRDENEVNKKNIFKFSTEIMEIKEDRAVLGRMLELTCSERNILRESEKKLLDRRDELLEELAAASSVKEMSLSAEVSDCVIKQLAKKCEDMWVENQSLKQELEKHQDPTENEKRLLAQQQQGFMAEIEKLKGEVKRLTDWDKTTCDFCENDSSHLVRRDAGHDERTCDYCHKEQYPEEYEEQ